MIRPLRILLRILLFPLSLFPLMLSCNRSSLSSGAVIDPSLLRVSVAINHLTDYDGRVSETVEAFVWDEKGETVANPQIQVKVNGRALTLTNGSSNYYGASPAYRLADPTVKINPDTPCKVTVTLTDGIEYPLGTIQTQPTLTSAHFSPPVTHTRNQPLTLNWQDLEPHNWFARRWKRWMGESSTVELKLSKSNKTVDQWGNVQFERGSTDASDYLTIPAESGKGAYTLPVSYLKKSQNPFNTLDILIDSQKNLEADGPFLKGSTLSSNRRNLYQVALTD